MPKWTFHIWSVVNLVWVSTIIVAAAAPFSSGGLFLVNDIHEPIGGLKIFRVAPSVGDKVRDFRRGGRGSILPGLPAGSSRPAALLEASPLLVAPVIVFAPQAVRDA
jgi:hypothetical protein